MSGIAGYVDVQSELLGARCKMRDAAVLYGDWAVHRGGGTGWVVTNVTAGIRIPQGGVDGFAEKLAHRIAELLAERMIGFAPDPITGDVPDDQRGHWRDI